MIILVGDNCQMLSKMVHAGVYFSIVFETPHFAKIRRYTILMNIVKNCILDSDGCFFCKLYLAKKKICNFFSVYYMLHGLWCAFTNSFFWFFSLFQIPVMSNALGGILVGLVTSYAGGVKKAS